jgi:hypothetical protein
MAEMDKDYRMYLEEKFKGIHIQMDTEFKMLNDSINRVEKQTIRTNGRVTELEQAHTVLNCPNTKKLDDIQKDLIEYSFLKKHPKIAALIVIAIFVMFGLSCFNVYTSYNNHQTLHKIENTK